MTDPIVHDPSSLTLLGGADLDDTVLNICLSLAPSVVAADGGADHALRAGLALKAVIGDMDSLSDAARSRYADVLHPVAEQDTTDFEKCLTRTRAPLVMAAGFLGGRLDHTLAALGVVARLAACHVVLVAREDVCVLLPQGQSVWHLTPGDRAALLPLGTATVTSAGLRWNLDARLLAPDGTVSSSNEAADPVVRLSVSGPVLLTLPLAAWAAVTDVVRGR